MKRGLNVLVVAGAVSALLLTGCSKAPDKTESGTDSASPKATVKTPAPEETEGAVKIEGAYADGSMWAEVGPLYRLDNGNSALALRAGYSSDVTRWPSNANVGQAIVSARYASQKNYTGIYVLNDAEVFEPLENDANGVEVPWVPQDPAADRNESIVHPEKQNGKQKDGLSESVLVPFGNVGQDTDSVGVSVGVIGFAADVPVMDADEAPKKLQKAMEKLPDKTDNNVHAPYSEYTIIPGMDVSSNGDNLEVTLAADVFFDSGKWEIKPESNGTLDDLAKALATHDPGKVSIVGHTDNVPDNNVGNQVLSENRANAVKAVLEGKSELNGFTFDASGKGETQPAVPNTDAESKARNRRVEVSINTPVKKEVLELQAANAEMPPAVGNESTWPKPVLYDTDKSGNKVVEITASEATTYPNYTLVNYTVKSVNLTGQLFTSLIMESHHRGENTLYAQPVFYGADILHGSARTTPLEYARPGVSDPSKTEHYALTGGGLHGGFTEMKANDEVTIPVLYPPMSDDSLTIDATREGNSTRPTNGWRITGIPNKKAE